MCFIFKIFKKNFKKYNFKSGDYFLKIGLTYLNSEYVSLNHYLLITCSIAAKTLSYAYQNSFTFFPDTQLNYISQAPFR